MYTLYGEITGGEFAASQLRRSSDEHDIPEQVIHEERVDVTRGHGILYSTDDDGRERKDDEGDEDAFHGVLDETERLPRVHCPN